jgi:hypothetical protein
MDIDAYWIDRVHRKRGFSGAGYHVFITRSGEVQWEGTGHPMRKYGKPGAHVGGCGPGWNRRSIGVCMAGGVKEDGHTPEDNFTQAQKDSLFVVIIALTKACGIDRENVIGHRDLIKMTHAAPKACPCFSVKHWLLQHKVEEYDRNRTSFKWERDSRPAPHRGEKLVLPRTHKVVKGDTLWRISTLYGVPMWKLRELNEIDGDLIGLGDTLRLR